MNEKQKFIEKIRQRGGAIRPDGKPDPKSKEVLRDLNNAVEKLAKEIYSKKVHFIFELIQNAEDNSYDAEQAPGLKFVLLEVDPTKTPDTQGCLCVFNNETGFQKNNVEAISKIGASTKTEKGASGYIGEKGIGFKSVFQVSSCPHIYSNGFNFRFPDKDPISTLGYITPYWLNNLPEIVEENTEFKTVILLPLKSGEYGRVKKELESFEAETILFLRKVEKLDIETIDSNIQISKTNASNICDLQIREDDENKRKKFWMESATFETPSDIDEEKRPIEDHPNRMVSVAFPLSEVTGKEKLFAYLPTEENPGLPFYLNADFLLSSSRETVLRDNDWNQWLFESAASVVVSGIMAMLKDKDVKEKAYRFIPLETELPSDPEHYTGFIADIQKILIAEKIILCGDNKYRNVKKSCFVPKDIRSLLVDGKPEYFNGKGILHANAEQFYDRLKPLGLESIEPCKVKDIVSDQKWLNKQSLGRREELII